MPKGFERCVRRGGRVRTIKPKGKKSRAYMYVCYDPKNKKVYHGEVKHRKKKKK